MKKYILKSAEITAPKMELLPTTLDELLAVANAASVCDCTEDGRTIRSFDDRLAAYEALEGESCTATFAANGDIDIHLTYVEEVEVDEDGEEEPLGADFARYDRYKAFVETGKYGFEESLEGFTVYAWRGGKWHWEMELYTEDLSVAAEFCLCYDGTNADELFAELNVEGRV